MNTKELPQIVKRALVEGITDIGQLSKADINTLNSYVKKGWLSKGKGGPFPMLKTCYAFPGFDFAGHRQAMIHDMFAQCAAVGEKVTIKFQ